MKDSFKKYFLFTFLFSIAIGAVAFIVSRFFPELIVSAFYFTLIYFFLLTLGFHYGLMQSVRGRPQNFVRYFMGGTTLKLLLHLSVIIIYSLTHRKEAMNFILSFFILYLFFTIYEMRFAMKLSRSGAKVSS
jgi:hypothetical protein